VPRIFGEHDVGGTQVLYLAGVEFEKLGFPKVGNDPVPELGEVIQHGIYKGFIAPIALYSATAYVVVRNLAKGEHGGYRVQDTWEDTIEKWLATPELDGSLPGAEGFSTHQVLTEALNFREHAIKRTDEMRAAKALKAIGFCSKVQRVDGKVVRRWARNAP
jgi:hypothetical protein